MPIGQAREVTKFDDRGKLIELTRVDPGAKSMNAGLDSLLAQMPPTGERVRTNLARVIIEDRE